MVYFDSVLSSDCINIYSYGAACVRCGCCSKNTDEADRMARQLKYYERRIEDCRSFNRWSEIEEFRSLQEKNIKKNILHFGKKIRDCKANLKRLEEEHGK